MKEGGLLIGRIRLTNHSEQNHEVWAGIAARLVSLRGGSELRHVSQAYQTCLKATSGNLSLQLTLEGMSKPVLSPIIGLEQSQRLEPGQSFDIFWQLDIPKALNKRQQNQLKSHLTGMPRSLALSFSISALYRSQPHWRTGTPRFIHSKTRLSNSCKMIWKAIFLHKSRGIHSVSSGLPSKVPARLNYGK